MRPRTLLVLAVLVAGLGAFIWFYERNLPSTEERRELQARVLSLEVEEVQAIALEGGGHRVRLERSTGETESLLERYHGHDRAVPADRVQQEGGG